MSYKPKNKIRIVTATSLFDGHDAAINIFRRIMQDKGAEVIHLGHNRSAYEIVNAALEEDVQAIAITSYQGGHMEFFKYIHDLLKQNNASHIRIFGGGGGVIIPSEIKELEAYGIEKIFSPEDGIKMGLEGMVDYLLEKSDFITYEEDKFEYYLENIDKYLPKAISLIEDLMWKEKWSNKHQEILDSYARNATRDNIVIGFTGSGGAGKSTLVDEILRRAVTTIKDKKFGVIGVDPTRRSGGALLADRIRLNTLPHEKLYMRSIATRSPNTSISKAVKNIVKLYKIAGFDATIIETAGSGQNDIEIVGIADIDVYVTTPEYGAALQLEKINMLEYADMVVLNKFDKDKAEDALYEIRKQYRRNFKLFDKPLEEMPVYGTVASRFNDQATTYFFYKLFEKAKLIDKIPEDLSIDVTSKSLSMIPLNRTNYLGDIARTVREYHRFVKDQQQKATKLFALEKTKEQLQGKKDTDNILKTLDKEIEKTKNELSPETINLLKSWPEVKKIYQQDKLITKIRDHEIVYELTTKTLSGNKIPKVILPDHEDYGEIVKFRLKENVPGEFPYTAGIYPVKRQDELPTRMFAGEGTPERTNKRFHYLSEGQPFSRLSTAFDSITLYGEDPDKRPDIYGKIGNAGVSVPTIDDAKKLYSGFDLCDKNTSVSMTINGPAPMMLAMFFNTAIDQQVEKYLKENGQLGKAIDKINDYYKKLGMEKPFYNTSFGVKDADIESHLGLALLGVPGDFVVEKDIYEEIKKHTLNVVRGTVQADILKEDQAQNTCLFSTDFSLKLMGDIQEYFIEHNVRNYYSVSISGYHIAEAGANPITQLAFTLANGFTYVEYYLGRGMEFNKFARNLSFFFSNGMDIEYAVIGRVARRIWAIAAKKLYNADERSQKLKYHIQTSGRSLHAMEIQFNDIRTTLQALMAIYDNCNSLHTNAYDEAITTPTEESVRRALAIQLIINKEFGMAKNENPLQGSYIIEWLTDLVEEEVLKEFDSISRRGGVLGAMESRYQRNKIQEESLYYETLKNSGELPIIGVNTFLKEGEEIQEDKPLQLSRSTEEEKQQQIKNLYQFKLRNKDKAPVYLERLKEAARNNKNIFAELMEAVKYCTLGQITHALFEVGGKYRRNM
ncbi:methylmalonyl-CoA mutase family protein [Hippea jasoniae]|uniref:methylmalonyl-CoA mutase family protein n=1 Tax=Hippea jasoniae TaxID=944479 RepID=UPI000556B96F|nr:methylmalonyl-CoA mutase family protein [Hippea jasoniae]